MDHSAIFNAQGSGLSAVFSGQATVDHVAIFDSADTGLRAQNLGQLTGTAVEVRRTGDTAAVATKQGALTLSRCVLGDARVPPTSDAGVAGFGVAAAENGTFTLDGCLLDGNAGSGLYAKQGGSGTVTNSVVRNTALTPSGEFGQGAVAEQGGFLQLQDTTLLRNHSAGLQVDDSPSTITALRVTVREMLVDPLQGRGRGANAQFGGTLTATNSAFVDSVQVGVFAFGARVELIDSVLRDTHATADGSYGNAVEAVTDGVIIVTRGALDGSASIGAVFAEGAGALDGVRVSRAPVGVHAQDGSFVEELDALPPMLGPREVVVTHATTFVDTRAKQSEGTVSVPPR
jgi:hypothetical protein